MARLLSSGFELNSATANVEWSINSSAGTISSAIFRSGAYAGRVSSLTSGVDKGFYRIFSSVATTGPLYARVYLRVATFPSAQNNIISLIGMNDGNSIAYITIDSGGLLRFFDDDGQVGSASSALSLDTWYRVEVLFDHSGSSGSFISRARIDGVEFAARTDGTTITDGLDSIFVGGNIFGESQTTGDWYFDDIAVNNSTGSFQNSWPGEGEIIHLRPNATGDNDNWTLIAGGVTLWQNVDEVTPDDGTTANTSGTTINTTADYNLDATPAALASDDTINVVQVGVRFAASAVIATQPAFVVRLKAAAAGTVEESSSITMTTASWNTNAVAAPRNYALTLYDLPGASTTAWAKADLDTAQAGVRLSNSPSIAGYLSTIWLLVDHKPAGAVAGSTGKTRMMMGVGA